MDEMALTDYLRAYFYDTDTLLRITSIDESRLIELQQKGVMPLASYRLKVTLECDSFLGEYCEQNEHKFYARGYASWLGLLSFDQSVEQAYTVFSNRYRRSVLRLRDSGFITDNAKFSSRIDDHIDIEWHHFLSGTYGVCTRSGLPEDIAAKECATIIINDLLELEEFDVSQRSSLARAVNLLDAVSARFAAHELRKSSRYRLVDEVRKQYGL